MKKHPLFKKVHVTMRFEQWVVDGMSELTDVGNTDRTEITSDSIKKEHKLKPPTREEIEAFNKGDV